ncbi:IclR family transcriptional regulator [Boudabousia liubingyangii]|uniref:IclR family transcriptional regulator n=1 Tax=Boudabousia liubingyangii TaxID=1921764 RepID=UPI0009F8AB34|nr:IclR family transcriptional regulator [Boudabousia liubingyangii]
MPILPTPVEAIDRALVIMQALAEAGPQGLSIAQITEALKLNKSTVYRALSTLKGRGFALQDGESGKYTLGANAIRLGDVFFAQSNLALVLHPVLEALSERTDELVHLGLPFGVEVMYVDKVEPARAIRVWSAIGQTVPTAWSALGRSLLAFGSVTSDQLSLYLSAGQDSTRQLIDLSDAQLWKKIQEARAQGYSTEIEENEPGIACLGVALMRGKNPIAAISITAQADRMTEARMQELYQTITEVVPPLLPPGVTLAANSAE